MDTCRGARLYLGHRREGRIPDTALHGSPKLCCSGGPTMHPLGLLPGLVQALFTLGAWPVGVWYASSEGACWPFGQILVVEQQAGRVFVGSLLEAGAAPGPTIIQDDIWEVGSSRSPCSNLVDLRCAPSFAGRGQLVA